MWAWGMWDDLTSDSLWLQQCNFSKYGIMPIRIIPVLINFHWEGIFQGINLVN